ncbi:MAG: hypothetical protein AMK73_08595 [Planctomycetes bacterium SM23_32]|nr:MAG: hypothetical protein AMK73_08595 [Planctomycetes bacterium SM23_32]
MRVDVDAVCRAVLERGVSEASLDEQMTRICTDLFGEGHKEAARLVLRMVEDFAERQGCTRLEAVRRLAQSQATAQVSTRRWSSLEDLPPDIRGRVAEMMESGEPEVARDVVTSRWDSQQSGPPPEVLRALHEAIRDGKPVEPGRFKVRVGPSWVKRAAVLGVVFLAALAFALLQVWGELSRPRGLRHFDKALARCEEDYAREPENLELGTRLAEAYGRKLALVRTLENLKRTAHSAAPGEADSDASWRQKVAEMEAHTGISGTPEEMLATARKGGALARDLLDREGVGPSEEATLQALLGHFLLEQGGVEEARRASDRAAELDARDVRPHLLNAAICERTGDYEGGIRENRAAMGKLAAWVERAPSTLQYLSRQLWPAGDADEATPRRAKERLAADVAEQIELHTMLLRAQAQAEEARR